MKHCVLCNGKMKKAPIRDYVYDTNLGDITIKGVSHLLQCLHCKNIFVLGSQMEVWNKGLLKKIASQQRSLTPKEIIFVFSTLPYSQNELARLVGRDRSTLSKYKTGENRPDHSFDFILKKIMQDFANGEETTMAELRHAYEKEGSDKDDEITSLVVATG